MPQEETKIRFNQPAQDMLTLLSDLVYMNLRRRASETPDLQSPDDLFIGKKKVADLLKLIADEEKAKEIARKYLDTFNDELVALVDRKQAEFEAVMNAVPAAIWISHDTECRDVDGNIEAYRLLELTKSANVSKSTGNELLPGSFKMYRDGKELSTAELPLHRAAKGQDITGASLDICFDNGEVKHIYGNARPFYDEKGNVRGAVAAFIDITDLKKAGKERERLIDILELTPDMISTISASGNVLYLNRAARHIIGIDEDYDVRGLHKKDTGSIWNNEIISEQALPTAQTEGMWWGSTEIVTSNGRKMPVSQVVIAHKDTFGQAAYYSTIVRNISRQKRMEDKLLNYSRELEERVQKRTKEMFRINERLKEEVAHRKKISERIGQERQRFFLALNMLPGYVSLHDPTDHKLYYGNAKFKEIFGDYHSRLCYEVYHGRGKPCEVCRAGEVLKHNKPIEWEKQYINGRHYHVWGYPFTDSDGKLLVLELGLDITERKQSAEKIANYQKLLKAMSSEISFVEEKQRRQLAEGLHDHVGQLLAASKMQIQAAQQAMGENSAGSKEIARAREMIEDAIKSTRTLTFELSPPVLYSIGLEAAIEQLIDMTPNYYDFECDYRDDGEKRHLDERVRVLLFRAVSELLFNIYKHASATKVDVRTYSQNGNICIEVADNGSGFDASRAIHSGNSTSRGFGLFSIQERLNTYNGSMQIKSEKGSGTVILLTCPINAG